MDGPADERRDTPAQRDAMDASKACDNQFKKVYKRQAAGANHRYSVASGYETPGWR